MSPYQFLKQLGLTPRNGGDGIRVSHNLSLTDLKTTAGLTLTAITAPTVANTGNAITIVAVAAATALGSFTFIVPEDYDEVNDELKVKVLVKSGGSADTPTVDAQVYRQREALALTSDLDPTASAAIPVLASGPLERTVDISGKALKAGDALTVNLITGGTRGTTDTVIIYSVSIQYKSVIVFNDPANR